MHIAVSRGCVHMLVGCQKLHIVVAGDECYKIAVGKVSHRAQQLVYFQLESGSEDRLFRVADRVLCLRTHRLRREETKKQFVS